MEIIRDIANVVFASHKEEFYLTAGGKLQVDLILQGLLR